MVWKPLSLPDDAILAQRPDATLYVRDLKEQYPLYRNLYLVTKAPFHSLRCRAHLTYICHLGRLRLGGDGWRLAKSMPELVAWIETECRSLFDRSYLIDTFGFSEAELDALIAAEKAKYEN